MITFDADRQCRGPHAVRRILATTFLGIVLLTTLIGPTFAQQTPVDGASCGAGQSCAPTTPAPATCTATQQALGTCTPPGNGGGTCSPAPGGNPSCSATASPGVTAGGSGGDVNIGGGNPINLVSGNKYQIETDLSPLPGVLGLELKRHYNSLSAHAGLMGAGWRMSYEVVLYDLGSQIQVLQADGQRLTFQRGSGEHAALCTAARPQDGQVRIEHDARGQPSYVWRWPDGRTLTFSNGSRGGFPLQSIVAPGGERLSLTYAPAGELVQVRDPQGRRLSFIYGTRGVLKAIDTPLGQLRYALDAQARLIEAASLAPGQTEAYRSRLYHYEDHYNGGHATALTGISLRSTDPATHQPVTQRLSTYAYDKRGLAILTTKGSPLEMKDGKPVAGTGIEQLQVAYVDKALPFEGRPDKSGEVQPSQLGKTVITNSLGATSTLLTTVIGGRYRLVSFIGPGCSTCGPSNRRYAYNAAGQVLRAIRLDERGQPVHAEVYEYDAYGRTVREGSQGFDRSMPRPTAWKKRYDYADLRYRDGSVAIASQPALIAEPSVIAGREHVLRFTYDERWQVTRVTESGFNPIDDQGRPALQGTPITRTTSYRYADVAARSLLVEIDGPLANGASNSPVDSDIMRIDYDAEGNAIARLRAPGGIDTAVRYDAFGRLAEVQGADGIVDRYEHDLLGHVLSRTRLQGGHVVQRRADRYDELDRPIERLAAQGEGAALQPQAALGYDIAGRLLWQADRLGILRRAGYDTEDHLLSSQVTGAGIDQQERYTYDEQGRLTQVEDGTGSERRLLRGARGRITGTLDPLGRLTQYRRQGDTLEITEAAHTAKPLRVTLSRDRAGRLDTVDALASDGVHPSRRVVTRLFKDDFGREVAVSGGDGPAVVKRYDEADRLVLVQDARGHRTELAYDAAGRLIRRTTADTRPRAGGEPVTTRFSYAHGRLAEVRYGSGSERYEFDGQGRVERRTTTTLLATGGEVTSTTRYRYDDQGRLMAQSLPDGSELGYERNGQGQIITVTRQTAAWAPFGWGRSVIAKDMERDLIGLRRITYGNGIEGRWQRSREGLLARVVYTRPGQASDVIRTVFERLLPTANAAEVKTEAPGAFGLEPDPKALWDSRLLFDKAGNVLVDAQFAKSDSARPGQTQYAYDAHNQLIIATTGQRPDPMNLIADAEQPTPAVWRYHDDSLGNRLLAQESRPSGDMGGTVRMAYAAEANRVESRSDGADRADQFEWNAEGRLMSVQRAGQTIARYRYDHRGLRVSKQAGVTTEHYLYNERRQRLAELDAHGQVKREYVWLADQLVATIDLQAPAKPTEPADDLWQRTRQALHVAWQGFFSPVATTAFVHANHLGAPVAMTDAAGKTIWHAAYAPFGRRLDRSSPTGLIKTGMPKAVPQTNQKGVRLDLRLPGQWEDPETGLHYNDQRYYDPERGRYISADPLGLKGGLNGYAYVGNNPIGYVDPLGLVLFAFDGTNNTDDTKWLSDHDSSISNVRNFFDLYDDGNRRYVSGVGTVHHDSDLGDIDPPAFDDAFNWTGTQRIDRMIQYFNKEADLENDDNKSMEVDIVGFSRGAAEARDFANQITAASKSGLYRYTEDGSNGTKVSKCQRVDFRFMGLWDTVLSTNSGRAYNLAIPDQFAYVAQATALNEYRGDVTHDYLQSFGSFPLESIMPGSTIPVEVDGKTRIERGFVGSHADIGGGFDQDSNQLAQVALAWMVDQAKAAGAKMNDGEVLHTVVATPVIHDRSDSILTGLPTQNSEDRTMHYSDGSSAKLRSVTSSQGLSYADTAHFINYFGIDDILRESWMTGTVDMKAYLAWLDDPANGYGLSLTVKP